MGEERLIGLAQMQCHRQVVAQLEKDLIQKFVRRQNRRMALVNILEG